MKKHLIFITLFAFLMACKPTSYQISDSKVAFVETNSGLPEDSATLKIIEPYKKQIDAQMQEIIGYSEKELGKEHHANEILLGNFIADITQKRAQKAFAKPVDFAFVTYGGLRTSIPAGTIRVSDIFELMPFENELVILELKGSTVRKLFEYLVARRNISISNSKVFIENKALKDVLINNKPIENQRTYYVATSDYLANGGDNLDFLKEASNMTFANVKIRDMIIEAIRSAKKIDAQIEGRVQEK